jgi:endonuclease YncB( thermonuclease family)
VKERKGKSRDRLRELIMDKEVIIKTQKDNTENGRYLAEVLVTVDGVEINVNDPLVTEGLAISKLINHKQTKP